MRRSFSPSLARLTTKSLLLLVALTVAPAGSAAFGQDLGTRQAPAEIETLFGDFLHFARLGKFAEAQAYATRLLAHPDLDPLELMTLADQDQQSVPTLLTLIQHTSLRQPAQRVLALIREGEYQQRQDQERIRDNVERLGGPPQMEYHAVKRLRESGEYAIPQMIDALLDRSKAGLWPRIIRALPQIGKPAVSPLVIALNTADADVRQNIAWTLGEIGYPQAVPYLLRLLADPKLPEGARQAAVEALSRIQRTSDRNPPASAVDAFVHLATQYFDEHGSVKADPRLLTANVWYWEADRLEAKPVPTEIYGPVMAMRACEEALQLQPDSQEAIALWLAANIRREARLGMDVESAEPDAGADADSTRGADFPRSIYFSRAAGPQYCHLVLGRALQAGDKFVALGAIAALDVVAGESSLIGREDYKQPLVQALRFADAEVRMKAGIALARALPKSPFAGADLVGHVLAEALLQGGQAQYVVVDGEAENLNRLAGELRGLGAEVVAEANFLAAMERARRELPGINGFILATDMESPPVAAALADLRGTLRFSRIPVVILVKPQQEHRASQAEKSGFAVVTAQARSTAAELRDLIDTLGEEGGSAPLDKELAMELALRAADALRLVAIDGRTVIDIAPAVGALIGALQAEEEDLQISAAQVLALAPTAQGQQAICNLALDEDNTAALRLVAFDALAESAKRQGNQLAIEQIKGLVQAARETADLTMRTAASQALGALNLKLNEASEIIRAYHRG